MVFQLRQTHDSLVRDIVWLSLAKSYVQFRHADSLPNAGSSSSKRIDAPHWLHESAKAALWRAQKRKKQRRQLRRK